MLDKIEALRQEPKAVRNRYAFGIALSSTLIIALIWGLSLPARLTLLSNTSPEGVSESEDVNAQLASLKEFVGATMGEIKTQAELIQAVPSTASTTATSSLVVPPPASDIFIPTTANDPATTTATTSTATSSIRQ